MSAAQQAKARRREMASNYAHLAPRQRPNYKQRDADASRRHLEKLIATERRIKQASKKK